LQASQVLLPRIDQQVQPRLVLLGDLAPGVEATLLPPLALFLWDVETNRGVFPVGSPALYENDIVEIIFTSGTTAAPKGVIMAHRNVAAAIQPLDWISGRNRELTLPIRNSFP